MSLASQPPNGPARTVSAEQLATERMLRAAVEASRELLAADLDAGLRGALRALGEGTGLDRVYAVRYDHGARAGFLLAEHCAPGIASVEATMGAGPYGYADFEEVWRPLMAGGSYSSPVAAKTGANADLNQAVGTKSDLFVPVFVGGVFWGALGFDDCTTARVYCDAEIQVLRAAAAALAAALGRAAAEAALREAENESRMRIHRWFETTGEGAWSARIDPPVPVTLPVDEQVRRMIAGAVLTDWNEIGAAMMGYASAADWIGRRATEFFPSSPANLAYLSAFVAGGHRIRDYESSIVAPDGCDRWFLNNLNGILREGALVGLYGTHRDITPLKLADAQMRRLERERADEAVALNHLLEGVVAASRALLDEPDFQSGLERWLAALAAAVDADRAVVGQFAAPDDPSHVAINRINWTKRGVSDLAQIPIPASSDFVAWAERLQRGESVWAHRDELVDARSVRYWEETDCFTNLIVPVVVDRRTVAWLCFDWRARREWKPAYGTLLRTAADGAAAAIKRNEAVRAMLAEREGRLAVEKARADESARLTELLRIVVSSARELIDAPDFESGLHRWLGRFGEATAAIRTTFYDLVDHAEAGRRTCRMLAEWTRPGIKNSIPVSFADPFVIDPRGAEPVIDRLLSGECIVLHAADCGEPMRSFLAEQGNVSVIAVPIFLDGRQWGCLSFDHAERRELNPGDIAVLQTAADTLAAILKRNEAVRAMLAEREGRAADLAALNRELEQRNRLLAASARASALLSAREDFDAAVVEAMGVVAEAAGFDRIVLVEHLGADGNPGVDLWRVAHEWHRPDLPSQRERGIDGGRFTEAPAFIAEMLVSERVIEFTTPEIPDESIRRVQENLGVRLMVAGNIFIDGFSWGCFGCGDCRTDRRRTAEEKGVIAAAARAVGQAVYRRRLESRAETLERQVLTEREQAARDRMAELANANEALRRSTANLAGLADLSAFHESLLLSAAKITGARVTEVFSYDDRTGALRMTSAVREGKVVAIGEDPTMEIWRHDMPEDVTRAWIDWVGDKEFSVIEIGLLTEESRARANVVWHIAEGHQLIVDVPLSVGGRLVGLLGLCFTTTVQPGTFALQQVRVLAQQAALAIQLGRLAESGRHAAVQAERNRIARDLHDTLAQGFTGVLAQLGALEGALEAGSLGVTVHYLERARELARFSLAEARSSVHALRPETNQAPLATRLRQMLAGMTQGTGLDAAVHEEGMPGLLSPAGDWCMHKFVQEALANAVKHSGARRFRVELAWGAEFSACVWDDGRGFDPATTAPGLGLLSMRERAAEAGGRLTNESRPGEGTRLCLVLPIPPPISP